MASDHPDSKSKRSLPSSFRLGDWLVEPSLNRISAEAEPLQLSPRNMKVLCYLAGRPGEVISRTELLDQIWSGMVVGEEVLTGAISELRQSLGDSSREPRYIETIRKGGYRLVMKLEPVPTQADARGTAGPRSFNRRRLWPLAVIVFVVLGWQLSQSLLTRPTERYWRAQPLTSRPGKEVFPALSPDGSRVAYVRRNNGDRSDRIYLRQCGTSNEILLARDEARFLSTIWSPDGASVAFAVLDQKTSIIRIVPALGGATVDLATWEGDSWGLGWSPDGQRIVASVQLTGQRPGIRELDLQTRTWRDLTTPDEGEFDRRPAYSPDGRTLAFARREDGGGQYVFLLDLADAESRPRRLTRQPATYSSLSWLPDGGGLVAAAQVTDHCRLWRIDLADGELQPEEVGRRHVYQASLPRRGTGLAATCLELDFDLVAVDLAQLAESASVNPERVLSSTWIDSEPCYSPSGNRIAFTSDRSGELQIIIADADGIDPRSIAQPTSAMLWNLRWSPDERQLYFASSENLTRTSHVLELATERRTNLDFVDDTVVIQCWAPDGEWFWADLLENDAWTFGRLRTDGRDRQVILRESADLVFASTDADTLILHAHDRGRLLRWVRGNADELPGDLAGQLRYAASRRFLYILQTDNGANTLFRMNPATGARNLLGSVEGKVAGTVTVTPDDSRLIMTVESRREMDLILVPDYR